MYSSIEEEARKEVIKKCYWSIFNLADIGVPIGIEAPAVTLEIINKLDPNWISSLSKYITEGKIEFIGSGYSQIIGPLVPAKVNEWNQQLGLERYKKLLGIRPKLALVNEMAYSGGIVEHYFNAGYEGLIMEWNNPRSAHPDWENEWRYFPQKAKGTNDKIIPLIWADSIAFQKYQRYSHGEYELEEYIQYLKSHSGETERFFPLYSNDVEIFDYRPGRYKTEAKFNSNSEWDKIIELYTSLCKQDWCNFVLPCQVLDGLNNENGGKELKLESASQPIPVKKQEKYNINRWGLTGRDDIGINSKCYNIYNSLVINKNNNPQDWGELCYLWSSDFRTHITEKRWIKFIKRLDLSLNKWDAINASYVEQSFNKIDVFQDENQLTIVNKDCKIILNKKKGLTIQKLVHKKISDESILGTIDHGYYDDITLGADFYSGHAVIEPPGKHKITDLGKVKPKILETVNGIAIKHTQVLNGYKFTSSILLTDRKIVQHKIISSDSSENTTIRPFNYTLNPSAWDQNSLYVETHNGGRRLEKYFLKCCNFSHVDIYSALISARHGFGNTEGTLIIGDKNKKIKFECEMNSAALIPSIIYKELNGIYFLRLQYSGREMDETIKPGKTFEVNAKITINV